MRNVDQEVIQIMKNDEKASNARSVIGFDDSGGGEITIGYYSGNSDERLMR
jgi:hypothetical protein